LYKLSLLLIVIGLSAFLSSTVNAFELGKNDPNWLPQQVDFTGSYLYAHDKGYVQIPSGGKPGTSSIERPTLQELGINQSHDFDTTVQLDWSRFLVYAGYQRIRPSGQSVLTNSLTTHGINIPQNTPTSTDLIFDWYRAGLGYQFAYADNKIRLTPKVEEIMWHFDYRISTPSVSTMRHFNHLAPRVGLEGEWFIFPVLEADLFYATSIAKQLNITTTYAKMIYYPWHNEKISTGIFLGIGETLINFKDNQPLANHVHDLQDPVLFAGVKLSLGNIR